MPSSAVAGIASNTPSAKEPVACVRLAARKAPSMYSEPCARLIMSMMPNTSVRPAANRNSIKPNCRPFSACSRTRTTTPLLHRAVLDVGVAAVLEDRAHGLVDEAHLRVLADHAQVVVLDRVLVAVELEGAARRLELGRLQRAAHRLLVVQPALGLAHCGIDEQRGVVALRSEHRGQPLVLLLEFGDEFLVGRVVEVERPWRGVKEAQHRF